MEERRSSNRARKIKIEQPSTNLQDGDFVPLKDESVIRNEWKFPRIGKTHPDENDFVRSVKLTVGNVLLSNERKGTLFGNHSKN